MRSKMFPTIHESLDGLNLDAFPTEWYSMENTYDEDGRFHSYDDAPAEIFSNFQGNHHFKWYNHGVLEHSKGEAVWVTTTIDSKKIIFRTYNEDMEPHSYKGKPSTISFKRETDIVLFEYEKNGVVHRDDDLPALVSYHGNKIYIEEYHLNGLLSRKGNLPAATTKTHRRWAINGVTHNSEDRADEQYDSKQVLLKSWYALYGVDLSKDVFEEICDYRKKTNAPTWAAFLWVLDFIDEKDILLFNPTSNRWNTDFPATWVTRCLGLNNENLQLKLRELREAGRIEKQEISYGSTGFLDTMLQIVKIEDQEFKAS